MDVVSSSGFNSLIECIDKAERLLAEAAGYGAQLVVFPEAFVGGYPRGTNFGVTMASRTAKGKEDFRKYHASAIDVPGKTLCPGWFALIGWIDYGLEPGLDEIY